MNRNTERVAIEWFVRLRDAESTAADREAHRRWLAEDSTHRDAYRSIQARWQELDGLDAWAGDELGRLTHLDQPPAGRRPNRMVFAAAASLAAMAVMLAALMVPDSGDSYSTAKGEQRRFVLEDGSRVHLNTASRVGVRFDRDSREVHLERGEGLFDIVPDPTRPFVVKVDGNRIVAVGTRFSVYRQDSVVSVTVLEGTVAILRDPALPLDALGDRAVLVEADTQATVGPEGGLKSLQAVDSARLTAWDNGLLVFDRTPLRQVALEMTRYAAGTIRAADEVADLPVTGTIKIRDGRAMVEVLAEVIPVTPVRSSQEETLLVASTPP